MKRKLDQFQPSSSDEIARSVAIMATLVSSVLLGFVATLVLLVVLQNIFLGNLVVCQSCHVLYRAIELLVIFSLTWPLRKIKKAVKMPSTSSASNFVDSKPFSEDSTSN